MARKWSVDPQSYELAKHFLPEGTGDQLRDMSQDIQEAVEDWFLLHESQKDENNARTCQRVE